MGLIGQVMSAMIDYYAGDAKRINHFLKVYGYAKAIGEAEQLDDRTQTILELSALTHDIGIKNSEKKYDSSAGVYQQLEGPPEARRLLENICVDPTMTARICWLIERHHTYTNIQGRDYQILVEADFLVNIDEEKLSVSAIESILKKIFKTETGTRFLRTVFL